MSTVDGTTNVRIVSFLRACDCQAFGIKIDVSSSWCVSFTNLLSELNRKWKDMFPNHANVYFIYDVDGNLVNTLDQLKVNVRFEYLIYSFVVIIELLKLNYNTLLKRTT